jgi:acyl carrier protein
MNREEARNKVIDIISLQLTIDKEDVNENLDFVSDLGFDSLDFVEITMCLEDEFGITIKDEDAEKMTNLKLVLDYLENVLE